MRGYNRVSHQVEHQATGASAEEVLSHHKDQFPLSFRATSGGADKEVLVVGIGEWQRGSLDGAGDDDHPCRVMKESDQKCRRPRPPAVGAWQALSPAG